MNARQTRYFTGIDLRADIKADNPDEAQRRALACVRADDRVALVGVRLCGQGLSPIRNGSGYRVGLQVILELEAADPTQARRVGFASLSSKPRGWNEPERLRSRRCRPTRQRMRILRRN